MLLAIDCGNTHIVLGCFDGDKLIGDWRISTDRGKTADEYMSVISSLLRESGISTDAIDGMIVGSVVPAVTLAFHKLAKKYLPCPSYFVDYKTPTDIKICLDNPAESGADRIINAVAAHSKYEGDLIIIDLGTATTFDCVTAAGEFIGGAICPGMETSQQALFSRAAKLANIDLYRPEAAIGRNTADALRSGILWGYGGQVDSLVRRMKQEWSPNAKVIATGGLATFLKNFSETMEIIDPQLTLDGLQIIWKRVYPTL